jgi:response regulator RpfG family c-di-GMP phosphodiesterase
MSSNKILIVDDESTVLELYQLQLGSEFDVITAESGEAALALLAERGACAIVVADMHMPGMNGTELLRRVQQSYRETVRMILTSDDQQAVAIEAVNEGQIFRFLNKPCPADRLAKALREGLTQYRLITAEKDLLANTLNGSINLLVEILTIVSPLAFGRATRVRQLVQKLCNRLHVENSWEISIAAMLSQVGCVSLPDSVLEKVQRGEKLMADEAKLYASHPQLGHDLVSKIPRLNRIADIIALQLVPYDDEKLASKEPDVRDLAMRADFLRSALDYDAMVSQGRRPEQVVQEMFNRPGGYQPRVLRALTEIVNEERDRGARDVSLSQLREGMVLKDDIVDSSGDVLITKGHELTKWLLERLQHQKAGGRLICEPIRILHTEQMSVSSIELKPVDSPPLAVTV